MTRRTPAALAGGEQRRGGRDLDAPHVVARAVLQHADAIDHGVDAVEQRQPVAGQRQARKSASIQRA